MSQILLHKDKVREAAYKTRRKILNTRGKIFKKHLYHHLNKKILWTKIPKWRNKRKLIKALNTWGDGAGPSTINWKSWTLYHWKSEEKCVKLINMAEKTDCSYLLLSSEDFNVIESEL